MNDQPIKEERIFEIPDCNWRLFEERFLKILKRSKKLNCGEVGYEVISEAIKQAPPIIIKGAYDQGGDEIKEDKRLIKWRTIKVWGDTPKLSGWTFVAKLEHDETIGTAVKTLPGYEIPIEFRDADRYTCDHCHKKLWRRDTFIVRNDEGVHKQVGRQCLRDFLGHENPEHAASYAEYFLAVFRMADDAEEYSWGGGHYEEEYFELSQVLAHTIAAIAAYGWLSRSKAETGSGRATADRVGDYFAPDPTGHDEKLIYTKEMMAETDQIIKWASNLPQNEVTGDDYLYNLSIIAKAGVTTFRRFGFACSMVAAYRRATDQARKVADYIFSEYFGEVGKRLPIGEVELIGVYGPFDSPWGPSRLYKFKKDNFVFTWFTGTVLNHEIKVYTKEGYQTNYKKVEIGEAVLIKKATVKEHKEWHSWKETSITRLTFEGLQHEQPYQGE